MAVQNLPFIENMEKRVQGATKLLDGSLERCFVDGLEHRDAKVIYNCLRAYAAIDNTSSAEELFRTAVVSPLIQKIIPQNYARAVAGASSDELEDDYQQIKECVQKDCKFILEISSSGEHRLYRSFSLSLDELELAWCAEYRFIFLHHLRFHYFYFVQKTLDCMFLIFWVIQYSKKSFLQSRKASLGPFLLESLKNS
jgi:hypothetical protein